jgi:hypothetical protein
MTMTASQMSFQCPFCREERTVRCGEFPYVRSQLIVTFERCASLPAGTSVDELAEAASELAEKLLAATYLSDARRLIEQQTHHA